MNDTVGNTNPRLPPDDLSRNLTLVGPDEDRRLKHVALVGDIYTILLSGEDTAGKFCLIDMQISPGGGPQPHRHNFEETFSVLEGECVVTFRDRNVTVRAGETANVPANAPHLIHNASSNLRTFCAPALQQDRTLSFLPSECQFRAAMRHLRNSTTLLRPKWPRKPGHSPDLRNRIAIRPMAIALLPAALELTDAPPALVLIMD